MLRAFVLVAAAVMLAVGIYLLTARGASLGGLQLCIVGALVIAGLLFERHYRPRVRQSDSWQATGERFIDPNSGKLIEVRYNPQTGERSYQEIEAP